MQLKEIVDANSVRSAEAQQHSYKSGDTHTQLAPGQQVLLSNEVAGKLDPRWTGPWTVVEMKGLSTVVLKMGSAEHKVHINRVRPLLMKDTQDPVVEQDWTLHCLPMSMLRNSHKQRTLILNQIDLLQFYSTTSLMDRTQ